MVTLYIIGNGFDLAHNLKTSYDDLKEYLRINNPDVFNQINEQLFIGDDDLWSSFEQNVGTDDSYFDQGFRDIVSEAQAIADGMVSDADPLLGDVYTQIFDNDMDIENTIRETLTSRYGKFKFDNLKEIFLNALSELLKGADMVSKTINKNKIIDTFLRNSKNPKFITFNYTHTLENIYHIPPSDILYLHGELGKTQLLFGNQESNITSLRHDEFTEPDYEFEKYQRECAEYNKLPPEIQDQIDPPEINQHEAVKAVDPSDYVIQYNESKKEWVKQLEIESFENFIQDLNVDNIVIFGHSLSEVDKEYFLLLAVKFPKIKWRISVYEKNGKVSETRKNATKFFPEIDLEFFSLD